jgi:hypothetical protein
MLTCATADEAEQFIRHTREVPHQESLVCLEPGDPSGLNSLLECLGQPGRSAPLFRHRVLSGHITPERELVYQLYPLGAEDDSQDRHAQHLTCATRPGGQGLTVTLLCRWDDDAQAYTIDTARTLFHGE